MEDAIKNLTDIVTNIVKENKGALAGAVAGILLSENEQAKSAILGAVAGHLIADDKKGLEDGKRG